MNSGIQKDRTVGNTSLFSGLTERLLHGDIGSLPVLLGLILIAVIFQIANPNFLTPLNLTNLLVQIAAVGARTSRLAMAGRRGAICR